MLLAAAMLLTGAVGDSGEHFRIDDGAIHALSGNGRDRVVAAESAVASALVSDDGSSVAWLSRDANNADTGSSVLNLRSLGRTRTISCEPFIRDYWFVEGARRIAIDCGGLHFVGRQILYDADTLKVLGSYDQAKTPASTRPDWAR
jgi:hypothetical protein